MSVFPPIRFNGQTYDLETIRANEALQLAKEKLGELLPTPTQVVVIPVGPLESCLFAAPDAAAPPADPATAPPTDQSMGTKL